MAITVNHAFVAPIADDPVAAGLGEVLPQSHWNANHVIQGGTDTCIIFDQMGLLAEDASLKWNYTNKTLNIAAGADNSIVIGRDAGAPRYNIISLIGKNTDLGGNMGLVGGASNDLNLYIESSGGFDFLTGVGSLTSIFSLGFVGSVASLPNNWAFGWTSTGSADGGTVDTAWFRDAAGVASLYSGLQAPLPNPTAIRLYNTFTNGSNYERGTIAWASNILNIGTQAQGTGAARLIQFIVGGVNVLDFGVTFANEWTFHGTPSNYSLTHAAFYVAGDGVNTGPGFFLTTNGAAGTAIGNFALDATNNQPYVGFAATAIAAPGDTLINRQGAGIVGIQNVTIASAAALWVYNTSDARNKVPTTNFERGIFDWTVAPGTLTIGTQSGGTGVARNVNFVIGTSSFPHPAAFTFNINPANGTNPEVIIDNSWGIVLGGANNVVAFSPTSNAQTGNVDTQLGRDAPGVLGVGNGSNIVGGFRSYNLTNSGNANYERFTVDWTTNSNTLTIGTQKLGTGQTRNIQFVVGNANAFDYGVTNPGIFSVGRGAGGEVDSTYFVGVGSSTSGPGFFTQLGTDSNHRGVFALDGGNNIVLQMGPGVTAIDTGISRIAPVSSVPTLAFGNGTNADASATIQAKTKAGAPTASDVPAGTWILIRDTTNATTKMYYNNAGTLQTVSLV